jgi:hypothetical protein
MMDWYVWGWDRVDTLSMRMAIDADLAAAGSVQFHTKA